MLYYRSYYMQVTIVHFLEHNIGYLEIGNLKVNLFNIEYENGY